MPSLTYFRQLIRDGTLKTRKEIEKFLKAQGFTEKQIKQIFKEENMGMKANILNLKKSLIQRAGIKQETARSKNSPKNTQVLTLN